MTFNAETITVALVSRLIATQFPQWAHLPITPAEPQGWDNRTFRLGTTMSVRLPSAEDYLLQVEKEHRWLPFLAPSLPLPIPVPLARGAPAEGYPWDWSVYQWLDGETAHVERIGDLRAFATALAQFLGALQHTDASGGPPPGQHSFFRGAPLDTKDAHTRQAIRALTNEGDGAVATAAWAAGLAAPFLGPPVWFHGDIAVNNLLVADGQLRAVIDFGCCGVGDPACDMAIAWTLFSGASRDVFRRTLQVDDGTWARGRSWALWKALLYPVNPTDAPRVIGEVLADYAASCG